MNGGTSRPDPSRGRRGPRGGGEVLPLRLAVGLGDPERERRLLPALDDAGAFVVSERCLSADQLLACVREGRADAALVATDLHRLSAAALAELAQSRLPLVLLGPAGGSVQGLAVNGPVLPAGASVEAVEEALLVAVHGLHRQGTHHKSTRHQGTRRPDGRDQGDRRAGGPAQEPGSMDVPVAAAPPTVAEIAPGAATIIAVTGGHGSPGRTSVAINLAAALGAAAPTVLVDVDLAAPCVAVQLDLDPTRNLAMLAHAEPGTPAEWTRAIAQELQWLCARSPQAAVLCGVPKPALTRAVSAQLLERLLTDLAQQYRYVVLDTGTEGGGPESVVQRSALAQAGQVLLVAGADLAGLWHARRALTELSAALPAAAERLAVVVNRHDRHVHHGRDEIAWALDVPLAAVIPDDHRRAHQALAAQRPLVLDRRSRAGRALLQLAGRIHAGQIRLPPEPAAPDTGRRPRWRRGWWRRRPAGPAGAGVVEGANLGHPAAVGQRTRVGQRAGVGDQVTDGQQVTAGQKGARHGDAVARVH